MSSGASPLTPAVPVEPASALPLILVGNPNVGKSVLFGLLTGRYVTVSNYPGTTVTLTRGRAEVAGERVEVLDTPGVNSLIPMSEDERVTRDVLLNTPGRVVQVADAKNLRRSLMLTSQLAEMEIPFVLDLNMTDEADGVGVRIDAEALAERIGVEVVKTVAVRRKGLGDLRKAAAAPRLSGLTVRYAEPVEQAIRELTPLLPPAPVAARSLAVMLLSGDTSIWTWIQERVPAHSREAIEAIHRRVQTETGNSLAESIRTRRLRVVDEVLARVETRPRRRPGSFLDTAGQLAMHPLWGVPVLAGVLWVMYQFVGVLGAGTMVDFLESKVFGEYLSPWSIRAADAVLSFPHTHQIEDGIVLADHVVNGPLAVHQQVFLFVHDLLVGPYGQITMGLSYAVALILPIVATFFIAFGILEDSGYLPRLAVMVNRIFRSVGLNGKAVLPMVLGLGCDTMATLTTRILQTRKERILVTLLLALGVPCSAQLGVILGMIRALSLSATLVWAGSIVATMFVVGWIASQLVPGRTGDFILELPPIRRPQIGNLLVKTMARIEWYLREAVPLFLVGTLLLFLLDTFHLLAVVERVSAPVVETILGLPREAAQAFLIGFLRRDYGAAGLYDLARQGQLDPVQIVVSMVTITLFVPCIANFLIMIKERGVRTAVGMVAVIVPLAFLVGGGLNWGLRLLGVTFQ